MTEHYRAEITLSHVTDMPDDTNSYARQNSKAVAHIDLVANSAAEAMEQMKLHVNMLRDWYRQPTVTGFSFEVPVRVEDVQ